LIVECLFVGAHSDVWIHEELEDDPDDSRTSGLFGSPYIHKHTTTLLLPAICSGSPGVHFIPYCLHLPAGSGLLKVLWLWLFLPRDK